MLFENKFGFDDILLVRVGANVVFFITTNSLLLKITKCIYFSSELWQLFTYIALQGWTVIVNTLILVNYWYEHITDTTWCTLHDRYQKT